ncbi:LysE family transporter [Corynebacterium sp. 4HC-13]|uniref:LysE family transporter n=2 Tax=Corynebacterium anserum TaxID=2684406 RepID=A0A7G7YLJ2_9CORY|nr:LysE family translocator [Corynebacterium anserum]MBC2682592.1 LysE family transporter [Corynebacterium anserum]QNH95362.1 LysE family transporter [Corynebacterium anserum]
MTFAAYMGLASAWLAAIVSPGPDTVQLIRLGSRSRRNAMYAALGISCGNVIWPIVTMVGLAALITAFPWILALLYLGGGLFLLRMGVGSFRGGCADYRQHATFSVGEEGDGGVASQSDHSVSADSEPTHQGSHNTLTDLHAWKLGLATNLSNPKALLFFGAVFAQFLPVDISIGERLIVLLIMTIIGVMWFCGFSWAVSLPVWAEKLQRANPIIEMLAGAIFALLALFLLYEGISTVVDSVH